MPRQPPSSEHSPGASEAGRQTVRILAWLAVVAAVAYLAARGIWRGATTSGDLAVGFTSARAWLMGLDPYDAVVLNREFLRAGGGALADGVLLESLRNVYFPGTLAIFVPLAVLSWPDARSLGLLINVAASVFIAIGASRLAGWRLTSPKSLALSAFVLALAPIHTTIAFGQVGILATAAVVAAMLLERSDRPYASGVLYGLATVVKVQIGLPFLVYLLWRRRWRSAATAWTVLGTVTAVSALRMQGAGVPWLSSWLANLEMLSRSGGINDPSTANPDRFSLINLQYALSSLVADGVVAQAVAFGLIGAAALALVWLRRGRDARPDLLTLAVVSVLGLLVAYHRYYDAVLLVIPIAWACAVLGTAQRRLGIAVLILAADFLLPLQSIFFDLGQRGILPVSLTSSTAWDVAILAQHVWALVFMTMVLLIAAARDRSTRQVPIVEASSRVQPGPSYTGAREAP